METYSFELYRALQDIGCDVELCKPGADMLGRPSLYQMARFFLSASWFLLRRARAFDAILLGDFALASLAPVARFASRGKARVVVSLHGNDLYFLRKRNAQALLYRVLARGVVASRSIDAAIANSSAIAGEAARHGIEPVTVVPLATVLPPASVMSAERDPLLVFTSRLIRYKGLSWFIREVWPHLDQRLELVVAGQVWDEAEHACLVGQPRVRYLGPVPYESLPALRARAIASIMPNIPPTESEQDEGFGLVALEAPAVGTPTVASRCGGIADAVAEGVTGFLLPPLDAPAWIARLNDLVQWPDARREAFSREARRHIDEHYNWRLVARRTLAALEAACRRGST
jgi:glycosyltransferase involved in cell wall biosynthesis